MRDKGQGSSAPQNQCCLRGVCSPTRHSSPKILTPHKTSTRYLPCNRSNIFPPPPPHFPNRGGRGSRTRGIGFCGPHLAHRRLRSFWSTLTLPKRPWRYGYSEETPAQSSRVAGKLARKGGSWEACSTQTSSSPT